tara:strand:- start:906 stop:1880 length:975 start_codon:yes stop_codon:yes gene_type:complete
MDKLLETLKESRGVRESTLSTYKRLLNKLSNEIIGKDFDSADFLKSKFSKVKTFIEGLSSSRKKNYLSSILVALSPKARKDPPKHFEKVYDKYSNMLINEQEKYNNQLKNREKNQKESDNWMEWSEIMKYQRKLGNDIRKMGYKQSTKEIKNKKDKDLIMQYLVLSLYTLGAVRRLEFADTEIIKFNDFNKLSEDEKDNNIYLVVVSRNKKFFSFGKNTVKSKTDENVKIPVSKGLNSVLNLWLNVHNSKYLLLDSRGNKMSKNGLSKFINKIFKPFGKKIGASMLRKIKISHEFDPELLDKKAKLAKEMNHSVSMQENVYLKK